MNFWSRNNRAILGYFIVVCTTPTPSAQSCGDFRKPETHFDGVNEFGFVSYWDQLGEIKLSDGSVLPLIIGFRSDWETLSPSPHLGSGWLFGLLDAHFVQTSENAFDMISIDGYTIPFGRDPKNPSILNGAQGWKAEIKGNLITAWADCGWKLQFAKGKISAITTPKNSALQIHRGQGGIVTDVIEGTTVLLKVNADSKGRVNGFSLGSSNDFGLNMVEKPFIQRINEMNVVGTVNPAIGKITLPDGKTKTFEYDSNANFQPTISITNHGQQARVITWDPVTKFILFDREWSYDIEPAIASGVNAAIGRTESTTGRKEFWHYDRSKGEEVQIQASGVRTIKEWFTSGNLSGKPRVISENGTILQRWSYDESGRLVKNIENDKTYLYDLQGRLLTVTEPNREVIRCSYDPVTGLLIGVWSFGKRIF